MHRPEPKTALIAGATGLVGQTCLARLLESGAYSRVVALVRRPAGRTDANLIERVVEFDNLAEADLGAPADVFCALGTTIGKAGSQEAFRKVDFGYPKRLADLALQAGARQFLLVSSVGADPKSRNFYLRVKGELEEALNAMPFDAVHAFRPSFLIGDRAEKRAGETIAVPIARVLGSLLVGVLRKYRAISGDTVAAAMVGAARESRSGRWVYHYDEMRRLAGAEPGSK